MKPILYIFFLTIVVAVDGQNLEFYDTQGKLIIDKTLKIDIQKLECIKRVENIIRSNVSPNLIYPPISYEIPSEGRAIIRLERKNGIIKINLVKGIDPWIDKEIIKKTSNIKALFLDSSICDDFEYYIPFEFIIGDSNCKKDSCISIVYPGDKARLIQSSRDIKVFQFESAYFLNESEILMIDSVLTTKFNSYIKLQKSGNIGIEIGKKKVYQNYLKEERDRILTDYNRVYYGICNEKNEKILKIVFSKNGIYGFDVIEYDLKRDRIERYYKTVTY